MAAAKKPAEPVARVEVFEVEHEGAVFVITRNIDTGEQTTVKK